MWSVFFVWRSGKEGKFSSTSSFLCYKWSNSLFKYFQNGYASEAQVCFPLPTLMKDDSKCNKVDSREIRLFIPNISANEKANLNSLSTGALQPSSLAVLLAWTLSNLFLLPLRFSGAHSLSRFLISRNPITHVGCRGFTTANAFIVLTLPPSPVPSPSL